MSGVNAIKDIGADQVSAFWSKVDIGGISSCWEWTGARKPKGYGNVRINKKYMLAHRVSWELTNFAIPSGYVVMHICDNPPCCNPSHLMLGTSHANTCDMLIKSRNGYRKHKSVGSWNTNAKFSEPEIIDIRAAYRSKKLNQYELADMYGVSQTTIGCIVNNKTWRHV